MYKQIQSDSQFLKSIISSQSQTSHVLFDCDGLILDTEPIYNKVALHLLQQFLPNHPAGQNLYPNELKNKVMGGSREQVAKHMIDHLKSFNGYSNNLTPQDWIDKSIPLESHYFSLGCPLMPSVSAVINLFVNELKWPAAVATSSSRHTFAIKSASHAQIFSSFQNITCGDDLDKSSESPGSLETRVKGKPDPSIFRTARHHLNRSPSQPGIVLEDSPNGVVAALRSGHSCIWVPAAHLNSSFSLIDDILNEFNDLPSKDLWVYKATSLKEIYEISNSQIS